MLVLGAYGLIGSAISRRLRDDGCAVTGLGRNIKHARAVLPDFDWIIRDLADLCDTASWQPLLAETDMVVNCAGALQQGAHDDLDTVHTDAVRALALACDATGTGLIQISAAGVSDNASTAFFRTKAAGDAAVRASGADTWIYRPGLVLAPTAYGGSTLLRMLAAVPMAQPLAFPEAQIQTIALRDLARVVSTTARGHVPPGLECDLVEDAPHSLRDVVASMRHWLGYRPARFELVMPRWTLALTSRAADILGRLGWRSPLRSSAVKVLNEGVLGDPAPWTRLTGDRLSPLPDILRAMPATVEDRQFARMSLLMPVTIAILFVFWLASGIIGFISIDQAARVLTEVGWPRGLATASVAFWALVDMAVAAALLVRKYAARACWAMVAVSLFYLVSATVTVPGLWADPLGPLTKVLPGIVLAMVARAMLETR